MLNWVACKGFRSLEDVWTPLGPITAIVGPNGAGKTAVLRAIDMVLGQVWPSLRSVRIPQDFTRFDPTHGFSIETGFDPPLTFNDAMDTSHPVASLRLACTPYQRSGHWGDVGDLHATFEALSGDGTVPMVALTRPRRGSPPEFRPLQVSTGLRDQARVLFIDHRRSLTQHLPSTRGSILGRLFEPARKKFAADDTARQDFKRRYEASMELLKSDEITKIEQTIHDTALRMLGFLGSSVAQDVDIRFGFADPANPFSSFRIEFIEGGLQIPGDDIGLGIQSAVVVGIFEALRQIGGEAGTIVIEEPEMYLHPQAQRYFYRILCELADNNECQVIYTSHSPVFADIRRFEGLRLCRKPYGSMTTMSYVSSEDDLGYLAEQRSAQKIEVNFDATSSELLFARKVLLVEGPGDRLAAVRVADKLALDPDAEGFAIISCGGKAAIPFFARACRAFGIPYFVMHDEDVYPIPPDATEEQRTRLETDNERARTETAAIAEAVQDGSRIFVIEPSLETVLGIGRTAKDKPRRVLEALEQRDADSLPQGLKQAVEVLFAPDR